jgi:xylulokinase
MVAAGMSAPAEVRASGGGLGSPTWRQILADVLDAEIATVSTTEGAAYGAALLATPAAGWFSTIDEAVAATVRATPVASPGQNVSAYREAHATYRELYPALTPFFHRG